MISWRCDLTLSLYRFTIAAYDRSALRGAARNEAVLLWLTQSRSFMVGAPTSPRKYNSHPGPRVKVHPMAKPEPQPCKRLSKMPLSAKFIAHLPTCEACNAVLAYLQRDSELRLFLHDRRN